MRIPTGGSRARCGKMGMVQNGAVSGNTSGLRRRPRRQPSGPALPLVVSPPLSPLALATEPLVAQQFQPVPMSFPTQQFRWTLAHSLHMGAADKAMMVEKELQQRQVVSTQLSPQKEIVAQPTIEV